LVSSFWEVFGQVFYCKRFGCVTLATYPAKTSKTTLIFQGVSFDRRNEGRLQVRPKEQHETGHNWAAQVPVPFAMPKRCFLDEFLDDVFSLQDTTDCKDATVFFSKLYTALQVHIGYIQLSFLSSKQKLFGPISSLSLNNNSLKIMLPSTKPI